MVKFKNKKKKTYTHKIYLLTFGKVLTQESKTTKDLHTVQKTETPHKFPDLNISGGHVMFDHFMKTTQNMFIFFNIKNCSIRLIE